ncbi:OLC1v1004789C1 [Oldenlandia corymbosa var. corymbosa]|uniref:OLC1v1004789C1 n=1 Tax=Oldenlandia corymbosa var. corymbosa TaxID=529605 RepID=A0AAV1DD59_OLDCO|nr:OLC1v1004789C1 [Oldenlandia corymbosa var. corymbosa]
MELVGDFNVGDYIPWFGWINLINGQESKLKRVAKELDEYFETILEEGIQRKDEKVKGETVMDVLLDLHEKNANGFVLQRESLNAIILDMFVAGTDTTYTLLEWALSELVKNNNIMSKLKAEVRRSSGSKLNCITEDNLEELPYLKAVIKETLRMHPPGVLIPRESTNDINIMGEIRGQNFELIPFGYGRRSCPGSVFALILAEVALANLILKFDFALPGETSSSEHLDMREVPSLVVKRQTPLVLKATLSDS